MSASKRTVFSLLFAYALAFFVTWHKFLLHALITPHVGESAIQFKKSGIIEIRNARSTDRESRNQYLESGYPRRELQNPRLSWIPLARINMLRADD